MTWAGARNGTEPPSWRRGGPLPAEAIQRQREKRIAQLRQDVETLTQKRDAAEHPNARQRFDRYLQLAVAQLANLETKTQGKES